MNDGNDSSSDDSVIVISPPPKRNRRSPIRDQNKPSVLTRNDAVVKNEELSNKSSPRSGKIGMMTPLMHSRKRHAPGQGLPSQSSSNSILDTPTRRQLRYPTGKGGTKRKESPQRRADKGSSNDKGKEPRRKANVILHTSAGKGNPGDACDFIIELPPDAKVGDCIEIRQLHDKRPLPKPIAITIPPSVQRQLLSYEFECLNHIIDCFEHNRPFKKEFNAKIIIQDSKQKLTPPSLLYPGTSINSLT